MTAVSDAARARKRAYDREYMRRARARKRKRDYDRAYMREVYADPACYERHKERMRDLRARRRLQLESAA